MRWLGMAAALLTLVAVVLNTIWFGRHADISVGRLLVFSGPTVLYLILFLVGVFAFGWLSARVLVKVDPRVSDEDDDPDAPGDGGTQPVENTDPHTDTDPH